LLRLGLIQVFVTMVLVALTLLFMGDPPPMSETEPLTQEQMLSLMMPFFVMAIPVILAFWFAPLLTGWDGVPPQKAVFFSVIACWRNLGAFAVYAAGVAVIAIAIPGLILTLGGLVAPGAVDGLAFVLRTLLIVILAPILMAGTYISYREVFHISEKVE
jgi:hypothetical protein